MKRALRRLGVEVARRTPGLRGLVAELQATRRAFAPRQATSTPRSRRSRS